MVAKPLLSSESTLTDRYQTTVPEPIRKALSLNKRDKIRYTIETDGRVIISRADESDPILEKFLDFHRTRYGKESSALTSHEF